MSVAKMKLTFGAMQILSGELQPNEMWTIYLMGLGKDMTEKVTKVDLTNIIKVLCKNLKWTEVSQDDLQVGNVLTQPRSTLQQGMKVEITLKKTRAIQKLKLNPIPWKPFVFLLQILLKKCILIKKMYL